MKKATLTFKKIFLNCLSIFLMFLIAYGCSQSNLSKESLHHNNSEKGDGQKQEQTVKKNHKKGLDITARKNSTNKWKQKIIATNVSWHYSWGSKLPDGESEPDSVEFVPMIWGFGGKAKVERIIKNINQRAKVGTVHYLLGFNEPDHKDQSNMTVKEAIDAWPTLMEANVPLGSPACANPLGDWCQSFMKKVDSLDYRVDFMTVHSYGGASVNGFLNKLEKVHNMYDRPIWVTEWGVADWKAESLEDNKYSQEQVKQYLKEILPKIDKLSYVKRYAWFPASRTSSALGPSALFKSDGSLTSVGKVYANH